MTNIERAARILHDLAAQESAEDGFPKPQWEAEPVWEKSVWLGIAQALAHDGLLIPDQTIIRTVEELDALDPYTMVLTDSRYTAWYAAQIEEWELPAALIREGAEVRACREALEGETT